jgi:hypothetical protein
MTLVREFLRWLLTWRFALAILVGTLVGVAGIVAASAVLGDIEHGSPAYYAVFVLALFAGSLVDREGFYGEKPGSRTS